MEIKQYIENKREIQDLLVGIIEDSDEEIEDETNMIQELLEKQDIYSNHEEFKYFLRMLCKIADHHHRTPTFHKNLEQIFLNVKDKLKQTFSNAEIFEIFQNNKAIIFILIKNDIITIDEEIFEKINFISDDKNRLFHFLYPEINKFLNEEDRSKIESEISEISSNDFEEKRRIGENDSYLTKLIRNDSIEEFVSYTTKENILIHSITIKPSIFETNNFLITSEKVTLIEYAAFYGSIQILKYLIFNKFELEPSLWLFSIHSQNAEIIHILEDYSVSLPEKFGFIECFIESIKCHHNDFANYFENNFIIQNEIDSLDCKEFIVDNLLHYFNFKFLTIELFYFGFFYLCKYDYSNLIKIYLNTYENEFKEKFKNSKIEQAIFDSLTENHLNEVYYLLSKFDEFSFHNIFNDNKILTKIAIPPSIKLIRSCSFYNCSLLQEILLPSSLTRIENSAFSLCSSLQEILLPSSLTKIENSAFFLCSSLQEILLPSSLTKIGNCAFNGCEKLTKIIIPSSVELIENEAFINCKSLKNIFFERNSSLKELGKKVFMYCSSLKKIKIPSSVKKIGKGAFGYCKSLIQVLFENPSSLNEIEKGSFEECLLLEKIEIPSSLEKISDDLFRQCSSLKKITFQKPSSLIEIGNLSFCECSSLVEIAIPSSVKSIGSNTFDRCSSLTKVIYDDSSSLSSFGSYTFSDCKLLNQITIPSLLISSERGVFNDCCVLTEIVIPSSLQSIPNFFFRKCVKLKKIEFQEPSSVKLFGKSAFQNCKSLEQLIIPSSVEEIDEDAFSCCSSLKKIIFQDLSSLTSVQDYAFSECHSLEEIEFPSSVTEFGDNIFIRCSELKKVILPSSLENKINSSYFEYSFELEFI